MATGLKPFKKSLDPAVYRLLRRIGEMACARGEKAYLVGGGVRDLILGKPSPDLDIVVEGRAISLAMQLAAEVSLPMRKHPRFGTAKIFFGDVHLDLVTARSETYPRPGALPVVQRGTIEDDLRRRDFSINAMAVRLAPGHFGQLLDPQGGAVDTRKKLVRVLHKRSFIDDPTRMVRAIRYEQRLGFRLDTQTEDLLRQGLDNLKKVSPQRRWRELALVLMEECPEKALARAEQLGLLPEICPQLVFGEFLAQGFLRAREEADEPLFLSGVYLAALSFGLSGPAVEDCIAGLRIPGQQARIMRDASRLREAVHLLALVDLRPSRIFRVLEGHRPEAVKAATVLSDPPLIRERLSLYLDRLRYVKPVLSGDDLKKLGVCQGRQMGRMLRRLHDARLDGEVEGRAQEEIWVKALLASE